MESACSGWSGRVWASRTRIALSRAFRVAAVLALGGGVIRKPVTVPRSRSSSRSWSALVGRHAQVLDQEAPGVAVGRDGVRGKAALGVDVVGEERLQGGGE